MFFPMVWKYFLPNYDFENIFCHLGWQDLPLFPPLPYIPVGSPMVLYGPICSGMVMNCLVWLCMFPYDPLWSCIIFEIISSPFALLCPVGYQTLADIESFAFLFFTPSSTFLIEGVLGSKNLFSKNLRECLGVLLALSESPRRR